MSWKELDICRPVFFMLLLVLILSTTVGAADDPFTGPANFGGTGLMETPTARIMKEGRFRVGFGQVNPYRYYYGAISPLKFLELGGRVTEIMGVPALTPSYGNDKDKAVDLKLQVLPEGKWVPAVAVGVMDPQGTRLYPSQYIVASKQIYPFDFTIG
ncbi:MAG: YjbH domain-containing protein, partial [Syntrophales bacterium]|nr:YjbH domain-containing protein [Syntrophales bacterium]